MQVEIPVWGLVLLIATICLVVVGVKPLRQTFQAIADLLASVAQLRRETASARIAARRAELERIAAVRAKQAAQALTDAEVAKGLVPARIEAGSTELMAVAKARSKAVPATTALAVPTKALAPKPKRTSALVGWWRTWNDIVGYLAIVASLIAGGFWWNHINTRSQHDTILVCSTYIEYAKGESGHRPQIRLRTPQGEFTLARGFYDNVYYNQGTKLKGFFQPNQSYVITYHGGYWTAHYITEARLAPVSARRCAGT